MTFTPPSSLSVAVVGAVAVTQGTSPWVVGDGGGSLTVDGPLTNAELRAAPVVVAGLDVQTGLSVALPIETVDGQPRVLQHEPKVVSRLDELILETRGPDGT